MKKSVFAIMALAISTTSVQAQTMRPVMDLATAETIRDGCLDHARKNGEEIAVAIFDHAGRLVTYAKMDGASTAAAEIAKWKGKSAATYEFASSETANWNGPAAPDMATFGGGLPLFTSDGVGIGGVGVSGAVTEFDIACGNAGAVLAGLGTDRPE